MHPKPYRGSYSHEAAQATRVSALFGSLSVGEADSVIHSAKSPPRLPSSAPRGLPRPRYTARRSPYRAPQPQPARVPAVTLTSDGQAWTRDLAKFYSKLQRHLDHSGDSLESVFGCCDADSLRALLRRILPERSQHKCHHIAARIDPDHAGFSLSELSHGLSSLAAHKVGRHISHANAFYAPSSSLFPGGAQGPRGGGGGAARSYASSSDGATDDASLDDFLAAAGAAGAAAAGGGAGDLRQIVMRMEGLEDENRALRTTVAQLMQAPPAMSAPPAAAVGGAGPAAAAAAIAAGAAAGPEAAGREVVFLTDFEGNLAYWERLLELAAGRVTSQRYLSKAGVEKVDLHLAAGVQLVIGGDICDKGIGSIRIAKQLLSLKRRWPDRVVLLLGNRDINKMRLTSELSREAIVDIEVPPPDWVPKAQQVSFKEFLYKLAGGGTGGKDGPIPPDYAVEKLNTRATRLKWILNETMGAAGDFEFRRAELAALSRLTPEDVGDDEVVESYLESLAPGGFMRQYLEQGQLAYVHGETLYVHGGIMGKFPSAAGGSCLGVVPGQAHNIGDVVAWAAALNAWKEREVAQWVEEPEWRCSLAARDPYRFAGREVVAHGAGAGPGAAGLDLASRRRGGDDLMQYVVATTPYPSVVIARHLDPLGRPVPAPPEAVAWLQAGGIRRVVCGHTPVGNCPHLIKQLGLEVLMADTSFSDSSAGDMRGGAASVVRVRGALCEVDGVLEDGTRIHYVTNAGPPLAMENPCDPLVGRQLVTGEYVKARLADGTAPAPAGGGGCLPRPAGLYLVGAVDGQRWEYSIKRRGEIDRVGLVGP